MINNLNKGISYGVKCRRALLLSLLSVSLVPISSGSGTFQVGGEIVCVAFRDGKEILQVSNTFSAEISDCNARIVTGNMNNPDIAYFEYGTHDDFSYMLDRYIDGELSWMKRAREDKATAQKALKKSANNATMAVWPTLVPYPMQGYITPVWIAYSSSCYLRAARQNLIDSPFFQPNFLDRSMPSRTAWPKVPAEWKSSSAEPHLLDSLVVFFDPYAPMLPKKGLRVTNAVYLVESWTKCGEQTIPKAFSLTVYRPDPNYKQNGRLAVEAKFYGTAKEFHEASNPIEFRLPVTAKTYISDFRFGDVIGPGHAFNYLAKESKIRSLDELRSNEEIRRVYFNQPGSRQDRKTRLLSGRALFGLAIVVPIAFFSIIQWRKINKN